MIGNMWVAIELTSKGETSNVAALLREVKKALPRSSVYVPVIEDQVGEDRVSKSLLDGYIFVEETDPPRDPRTYGRLAGGRLIEKALFSQGRPSYISDEYIEDLRQNTKIEAHQGIGVGDLVEICSGPYKSIRASVVLDLPTSKSVQVYVQLRSKQTLLTLPRSALKVLERTTFSYVHAKISYIRVWHNVVTHISQFSLDPNPTQMALSKLTRLYSWGSSLTSLVSFLSSEATDTLSDQTSKALVRVHRLFDWVDRGKCLYPFVLFEERTNKVSTLLGEISCRLHWLQTRYDTLEYLSAEVENLNRQIEREDSGNSISSVFVDGPSLLRHFDINDLGGDCIKSLIALVENLTETYCGSQVTILWGQSDSRISEDPEYMTFYGNSFKRLERSAQAKIDALGYSQVTCDSGNVLDILSSLLDDGHDDTLIYSSDKNLLQLVDGATKMIYPAKGSRKAITYDLDRIMESYKSPPSSIPDLLSLLGNVYLGLSCVQRVPKGVLHDLISENKTLEGAYAHGLGVLDQSMYDRVRTAEAKARLHLSVLQPRDTVVLPLKVKA
jgi:transcription antitermination factor NusG